MNTEKAKSRGVTGKGTKKQKGNTTVHTSENSVGKIGNRKKKGKRINKNQTQGPQITTNVANGIHATGVTRRNGGTYRQIQTQDQQYDYPQSSTMENRYGAGTEGISCQTTDFQQGQYMTLDPAIQYTQEQQYHQTRQPQYSNQQVSIQNNEGIMTGNIDQTYQYAEP